MTADSRAVLDTAQHLVLKPDKGQTAPAVSSRSQNDDSSSRVAGFPLQALGRVVERTARTFVGLK
jgi:hypothetical protein